MDYVKCVSTACGWWAHYRFMAPNYKCPKCGSPTESLD